MRVSTWHIPGMCTSSACTSLNCTVSRLCGVITTSTKKSLVQQCSQLCFLLECSFSAAARSALTSVEPQHPGFVELALRHRYPLRHLSTLDLPFCDLGSYLAKVQVDGGTHACMSKPCWSAAAYAMKWAEYDSNLPAMIARARNVTVHLLTASATCQQAPSSLTSLDIDIDTLQKPAMYRRDRQYLPMADVLQGICSLRRLSCPVRTRSPFTATSAFLHAVYGPVMGACVNRLGSQNIVCHCQVRAIIHWQQSDTAVLSACTCLTICTCVRRQPNSLLPCTGDREYARLPAAAARGPPCAAPQPTP